MIAIGAALLTFVAVYLLMGALGRRLDDWLGPISLPHPEEEMKTMDCPFPPEEGYEND